LDCQREGTAGTPHPDNVEVTDVGRSPPTTSTRQDFICDVFGQSSRGHDRKPNQSLLLEASILVGVSGLDTRLPVRGHDALAVDGFGKYLPLLTLTWCTRQGQPCPPGRKAGGV